MNQPTTAFYSELQKAYDTFNRLLWDGKLPQCLITLQRKERAYGYFSRNRFGNQNGDKLHELAMNPTYFAVVPLVEIMATLVHEQSHVWQYEFGKPGRASYHNHEWADKMESIGLMPSSTGRPGGARTGDKMADYPIEGGRFLAACRELLDDDFKIAWYDRFGQPPSAGAEPSGAALVQTAQLPAPATTVAALTGLQMEPAPAKPTANKSNRSKYTCGCDDPVAVWGKPALNLICGECTQRFTEIP